MSHKPNSETLSSEHRVTPFRRKRDPAPDQWAAGYGSIYRSLQTPAREFEIGELLALVPPDSSGAPLFDLRRRTCIVGGFR